AVTMLRATIPLRAATSGSCTPFHSPMPSLLRNDGQVIRCGGCHGRTGCSGQYSGRTVKAENEHLLPFTAEGDDLSTRRGELDSSELGSGGEGRAAYFRDGVRSNLI